MTLQMIAAISEIVSATVGLAVLLTVAFRLVRLIDKIAAALHVHREHVGPLHANGIRPLFDPMR